MSSSAYLTHAATDEEVQQLACFKRRLRCAAAARGYTSIFDVGRDAGISAHSFRHYASGTRMPSALTLIRLSNTLNVPTDWLLGYPENVMLSHVIGWKEIKKTGTTVSDDNTIIRDFIIEGDE